MEELVLGRSFFWVIWVALVCRWVRVVLECRYLGELYR